MTATNVFWQTRSTHFCLFHILIQAFNNALQVLRLTNNPIFICFRIYVSFIFSGPYS